MTVPPRRDDSMRLVEESVHLLRSVPAEAWATYLAGAVPFGIGLIWFWLETTRSIYAQQNLVWTSALVGLLFLGKQVSEAAFLARLRGIIGQASTPVGVRRFIGVLVKQAAIQPTCLILLPVAALATIPFAQSLSFYRQFSFAAWEGGPGAISRAWTRARHESAGLWTLLGVLALGVVLLYSNLLAMVIISAMLANSFFGLSNVATSTTALLSNTTVHLAVLVAVYFAMDLVLDAAMVLQGFRAVSLRTGEDILARLARVPITVAVLLAFTSASVLAQQPAEAQALDQAIDQTLRTPEFAWRAPAQEGETPQLVTWIAAVFHAVSDFTDKLLQRISDWLRPTQVRIHREGEPVAWSVQYWLIGLAIVAIVALVVLLFRSRRRRVPAAVQADSALAEVDVRQETVMATALPEDEWLRMADQFLAAGDLRLALRSLHLACLRILSEQNLIRIERWKTGMEYLDEVRRRSRQKPELTARFRDNLRLFEFGWYSRHPVEQETISSYRTGLEAIRGNAQ